MRLPRIVRTSSFRLTLLYAGLFGASVLVLFGAFYWIADNAMTSQLDAAIESDLTELRQGFREGGAGNVAALIAARVKEMPSGPMFYLLQDAHGTVLAGNLPRLEPQQGPVDLDLRAPRGRGHAPPAVRARGFVLPGGDYLVVGADAAPLDDMREWTLRAFAWSFAITLLMAFGAAAFLSQRLLRRVETISRTARDIMDGNLSRRIPLRGVDDEFDHLGASLNAMLERIEESIDIIRQVSNDVAHDLRTPLARLRHRLELADRKASSPDEWRSAIRRSIDDTDAILGTFAALLRIAQIESGARRDKFTTIDLSELLNTVIELYQPMADERRQRISTRIASGLCARGDRELLAQMFANLLQNALQHAPEGASVELSAIRSSADAVEVVLSDTGPGIPAAEREKVFRRFYRLERSRTTPGNGLGLSLVAAVADLHDVGLALDDNDPGLKVTLRLRAGA
ncbi:MAG TPA: ATP-binding protein [Stellaceae bacterium]|nr:ATP-binding protein [Stellaceae bacterium]